MKQQTGKLPFISVVVPAYNEEAVLGACIESLLSQHYPRESYEIIVVNNHSTDSTRLIAQRYLPQITLLDEAQLGVQHARGRGAGEAKGDIIACTDADCVVNPDWLSKIAEAFVDPLVVAVGGNYTFHGQEAGGLYFRLTMGIHYRVYRLMTGGNMAFRASAYRRVGGFAVNISLGEDAYISHRLKKIGKLVILRNNPVDTCQRRRSWDQVIFGLKSAVFLTALLVFGIAIPISFKHIVVHSKSSNTQEDLECAS